MAQTPSTEDLYTGDGTNRVFAFHFPFLDNDEVFVSVDGVNVPFVFLSGSTASVETLTPPPAGSVVKVYRDTEAFTVKHLFAGGVPFLPRYVDENNRQLLYATQEAINDTAVTAAEALVVAEEAKGIAEEALDKVDGAIIDSAYQLRLDLGDKVDPAKGSGQVGFIQDGINAVGTDARRKMKQTISVFDFMTPAQIADVEAYTYSLDVTDAIKAAIAYVVATRASNNATSGDLTTSYTGTIHRLWFPKGGYRISDKLPFDPYMDAVGARAVISQFDLTKAVVDCEAYQLRIRGLQFVGGLYGLDFYNANTNSTMVKLKECDFLLSRDYAIRSRSTHATWTHLSCSFNAENCRVISCNKIMDNVCDNAVFDSCWLQPSKINLTASTAMFRNRGRSATDLDSQTRLHLRDCFLIPDVGAEGTDRVNSVRWIDNYGSFRASHSRFGGEDGGMSILWHFQAPNTLAPWNTTEVVFDGCQLFSGPDARIDSCVLGIQGQIPNRFTVRDCTGLVGKPLIANLSSLDIPAYMTAFETASGRKAYDWFKISADNLMHDVWAYGNRSIMPDALYRFVVRNRSTSVRRGATQSIPTGMGSTTPVAFDTLVEDNVGAWVAAQPTRLAIPFGCHQALITVNLAFLGDSAAKYLEVTVKNDSAVIIGGDGMQRGAHNTADRISISVPVSGVRGNYFTVEIRHNGASALTLAECSATLTALDYVG